MRGIRFACLGLVAILGAACGADVNDVDPRVVPGGGIADGEIEGELNVHVIDSVDDAPVSGALVLVGEPDQTPLEGDTDSSGLIVFEDDSLSGPETITVVADGYITTTWYGANGANVTIPIDDATPTQSSIPQATLSGTIAGWDGIPIPTETNRAILGIVGYSSNPSFDDDANNLEQPGTGFPPPNVCVRSILPGDDGCSWDLITRTGDVAVFALIAELDTMGDQDESNDTVTIIGFAFADGLSVEDGVDQSGISLDMIDAGDLATMTVNTDPAPAGLTDTGVIVQLDLGNDGLLSVGASFDNLEFTVPDLVGPFADASYQLVGVAGDQDAGDDQPGSFIIDRGITSVGEVDMSPWLELAGGLAQSDGELSYERVDGAELHVGALFDSSGDKVWGLAFFDNRDVFTLPAIDPDPLPSSGVDLTIGAFDGELDVRDLELDNVFEQINRFSNARSNDIL